MWALASIFPGRTRRQDLHVLRTKAWPSLGTPKAAMPLSPMVMSWYRRCAPPRRPTRGTRAASATPACARKYCDRLPQKYPEAPLLILGQLHSGSSICAPCAAFGWSRNVLLNQVEAPAHGRSQPRGREPRFPVGIARRAGRERGLENRQSITDAAKAHAPRPPGRGSRTAGRRDAGSFGHTAAPVGMPVPDCSTRCNSKVQITHSRSGAASRPQVIDANR